MGACYKINRIRSQKEDIFKLVISKELSKTREEYAAKQPHAELAYRMALRDPGSAPKLGERIPYVVINTGNKKHKLYEKTENPDYAITHNIPIDTDYYITNQVVEPLVRLFEPVYKDEAKIKA